MIEPKSVETWWEVEGLDCQIYIESRPRYCDRGNYIAKIDIKAGGDPLRLNLDWADGWPRYYFDWDRMLAEIDAWLVKRKQVLVSTPTGDPDDECDCGDKGRGLNCVMYGCFRKREHAA